jgi:hypothetical protein
MYLSKPGSTRRVGERVQPDRSPASPDDVPESRASAYLVLTLRLSEEAAELPVIEVIRTVRNAAVALAASRGTEPDPQEVEQVARRRLGLTG